MAKLIRIIFFYPIHILLWLAIRCRHFLYDIGFISSNRFSIPVICVGNLELGGSGKTPMSDFLINRFHHRYKIAFLSRGYGRSSKGFRWLKDCSGPLEGGDEPWQLFSRWKDQVVFAVDENRVRGAKRIMDEMPDVNLIILDDAFQHRRLHAGLNILLTPFSKPFFKNFLFPAGSLRDIREAASRAQMLVFTKAESAGLESLKKAKEMTEQSGITAEELYVSEVAYDEARNLQGAILPSGSTVVAVAGLAHNQAFFTYCEEHFRVLQKHSLPDHFRYSPGFFQRKNFQSTEIILCTEKDFAKIISVFPFPEKVFYLPVHIRIYPEEIFLKCIEKYLSA